MTKTYEKKIVDIQPIEQTGGLLIKEKSQIKDIVETPLVKACEELFEKNISTTYSSANKKDIQNNYPASITLEYDSLSNKNKKIAEKFGEVKSGYDLMGNHYRTITIRIPMNKNTTVKEIEKESTKIADMFEPQPLLWGGFSKDDLENKIKETEAKIEYIKSMTPKTLKEEDPSITPGQISSLINSKKRSISNKKDILAGLNEKLSEVYPGTNMYYILPEFLKKQKKYESEYGNKK